jgi:hypothetical protein
MERSALTAAQLNHVTSAIIRSAIQVHRALGPGLLESAYRVDAIVNRCVLVEVKAIDQIARVHLRQMLTYLKLADCRVGLLLNFGASTMRDGIHRVVNDFPVA